MEMSNTRTTVSCVEKVGGGRTLQLSDRQSLQISNGRRYRCSKFQLCP